MIKTIDIKISPKGLLYWEIESEFDIGHLFRDPYFQVFRDSDGKVRSFSTYGCWWRNAILMDSEDYLVTGYG